MVVLKSSSDMLSQSDVDAIRAVVTKAVPSLTEENISVVDQNMHSYGSASASSGVNQVDTQVNLQQKVASDLEQQIVNLLSPVFGPENLSASVNVTLNFDKTTTNSLTLTPPTNDAENMGIITSMKQTEERLQNGGTCLLYTSGVQYFGGNVSFGDLFHDAAEYYSNGTGNDDRYGNGDYERAGSGIRRTWRIGTDAGYKIWRGGGEYQW